MLKLDVKWRDAAGLIVCLMGLAGCAVGPKYKLPEVKTASSFGELSLVTNATQAAPVTDWWRTFNDPELNHLISEALQANYDVAISLAHIRESRFQRSIVAADLFPNIDANGGYLRTRGSKNVQLSLGGSGSSDPPSSTKTKTAVSSNGDPPSSSPGPDPTSTELSPFGLGGLPGVTSSLYQIGFDATWELDVFGGNRKRLEAAADDLTATVEQLRDTCLTLTAEVARDYLELRGTQQRLAVAVENLGTQKEVLDLTKSQAKSGLATENDVFRATAQLSETAASIPGLQANIRTLTHALSTLLAQEPMALSKELESGKPLPLTPPVVPVGLPSDLLKRRPDIRHAERQIAAATARLSSARADLFPKFALTGGIGLDSTSPGTLFNAQSRYFLISPTVVWRVFDAGRIISNIALQKATEKETILQYRSIILTALQQVEDALVAYGSEQTRHHDLNVAYENDRESLKLTRSQYENGLVSFIEVLDAERTLLLAQDNLVQSEETITTDLVALYKALGGGWH
ncbi:MAG TPA: efflux transporter outer membrane subunit [Candidatus Cybelea sp.]|jgi:multidrug efflux system outer membrane protein|nr:efflux transporter outer membrane subunit [Candidatus Cybelea sp.]